MLSKRNALFQIYEHSPYANQPITEIQHKQKLSTLLKFRKDKKEKSQIEQTYNNLKKRDSITLQKMILQDKKIDQVQYNNPNQLQKAKLKQQIPKEVQNRTPSYNVKQKKLYEIQKIEREEALIEKNSKKQKQMDSMGQIQSQKSLQYNSQNDLQTNQIQYEQSQQQNIQQDERRITQKDIKNNIFNDSYYNFNKKLIKNVPKGDFKLQQFKDFHQIQSNKLQQNKKQLGVHRNMDYKYNSRTIFILHAINPSEFSTIKVKACNIPIHSNLPTSTYWTSICNYHRVINKEGIILKLILEKINRLNSTDKVEAFINCKKNFSFETYKIQLKQKENEFNQQSQNQHIKNRRSNYKYIIDLKNSLNQFTSKLKSNINLAESPKILINNKQVPSKLPFEEILESSIDDNTSESSQSLLKDINLNKSQQVVSFQDDSSEILQIKSQNSLQLPSNNYNFAQNQNNLNLNNLKHSQSCQNSPKHNKMRRISLNPYNQNQNLQEKLNPEIKQQTLDIPQPTINNERKLSFYEQINIKDEKRNSNQINPDILDNIIQQNKDSNKDINENIQLIQNQKYINKTNQVEVKQAKKQQQIDQLFKQLKIKHEFGYDSSLKQIQEKGLKYLDEIINEDDEISVQVNKLEKLVKNKQQLFEMQCQEKIIKKQDRENEMFLQIQEVPQDYIDLAFEQQEQEKQEIFNKKKLKQIAMNKVHKKLQIQVDRKNKSYKPDQISFKMQFQTIKGLKHSKQNIFNLGNNYCINQDYLSNTELLKNAKQGQNFKNIQTDSQQYDKDIYNKNNQKLTYQEFVQGLKTNQDKHPMKILEQKQRQRIWESNQGRYKSKLDNEYIFSFVDKNSCLEDYQKYKGISDHYPALFCFNIPKMLNHTCFNRQQLYYLFTKYKSIMIMEYERKKKNMTHYQRTIESRIDYQNNFLIGGGIDQQTFQKTNPALIFTPESIIEHIFTHHADPMRSHKMEWQTFVKTVDMLEARSVQAQIELFMELMDHKSHGYITYDDVVKASSELINKICNGDMNLGLGQLLVKTVYNKLGISYDQKITQQMLLNCLQEKSERQNDLQLLLMLCVSGSQMQEHCYSDQNENQYTEGDENDRQFNKQFKDVITDPKKNVYIKLLNAQYNSTEQESNTAHENFINSQFEKI